MRVKDYGLNAYREYEIIRDYNQVMQPEKNHS